MAWPVRDTAGMASLYDFTVSSATGPVDLWDHHGSVVLVVHTGRETGPTPQLVGLERLATTFAGAGLVVLAFPDSPLPGSPAPSAPGLGVTFPVLAPADDPSVRPLFDWLLQEAPGPFGTAAVPGYTKFLVGRDGAVIRRFAATDDAAELVAAVRIALAQPVPPAPPKPAPPVVTDAAAGPTEATEAMEPAEPAAPGAPPAAAELAPPVAGSEPSAPAAPAVSVPDPAVVAAGQPAPEDIREDSLADIAQDIYEVESEVRMVEELGREQQQAAIDAELAAALGEQLAISQSDQPGSSLTSDPSIPDGESTPTAPDQRPAPRDRPE